MIYNFFYIPFFLFFISYVSHKQEIEDKKYKSFEVLLESLSPTQIKMDIYEREQHVITIYKQTGLKVSAQETQGGRTFPMEMILTKL